MTKFFIDQHGCAKNQVDGELLIERLRSMGLEQTFDAAEADCIIVNSCGFIESAKQESLDAVCAARKAFPAAKILLAGCLAERYAETLADALPEADGIFGNGSLDRICDVVRRIDCGERPVLAPPQNGVCCGERQTMLSFRGSAFVKLTEGCSNHCSFCAIPLIRGELRSRRADDILAEIRTLVSQGIAELNLIGQDVAAYGTGASDDVFGTGRFSLPECAPDGTICGTPERSALSLLLERISSIPGEFSVRLLYIHPDHFNKDILPVIRREPRILHYFDIPFQSGDDRIIRAMNRRGSAAAYRALVQDIRAALPDAVIRTTFLAGFPGETEDEAEHSRAFLHAIRSDWSGCFPYSREEDTPSYSIKKRVPAAEARKRADALRRIQNEITRNKLAGYVGSEYDILIEEVVSGADGLAIGRAWFQAPDVDGSVVVRYDRDDNRQEAAVRPGRFVRAKIEAAGDIDLNARFVGDSPRNAGIPRSPLVFAPEQQDG